MFYNTGYNVHAAKNGMPFIDSYSGTYLNFRTVLIVFEDIPDSCWECEFLVPNISPDIGYSVILRLD